MSKGLRDWRIQEEKRSLALICNVERQSIQSESHTENTFLSAVVPVAR